MLLVVRWIIQLLPRAPHTTGPILGYDVARPAAGALLIAR